MQNNLKDIEFDRMIRQDVIGSIYGKEEPLYESKFATEEELTKAVEKEFGKPNIDKDWTLKYTIIQNGCMLNFEKALQDFSCSVRFTVMETKAPIAVTCALQSTNKENNASYSSETLGSTDLLDVKEFMNTVEESKQFKIPFNEMYAFALNVYDLLQETPERPYQPAPLPEQPAVQQLAPEVKSDDLPTGLFTPEDVISFKESAEFLK